MVRLRTLRLSLTTLALIGARPVLAGPINFSGFVENDFNPANPDVRVIDVASSYESIGQRPWMTQQGLVSGWAIKDIRTSYDQASDTLFVGLNTFKNANGQYAIVGDVDGNGNPGTASANTIRDGGVDYANLGGHESVAIGFASDGPNGPNSPGNAIFVAGVSAIKKGPDTGVPQFDVARATGGPLGYNFGQSLTNNLGSLAFNPSADRPGFEFTVKNFSKIPGINPFNGFWIEAYAGSPDDVVSGETGLRFTRVRAFAPQEIPEPAALLAWSVVIGGVVVRFRLRRVPAAGR